MLGLGFSDKNILKVFRFIWDQDVGQELSESAKTEDSVESGRTPSAASPGQDRSSKPPTPNQNQNLQVLQVLFPQSRYTGSATVIKFLSPFG